MKFVIPAFWSVAFAIAVIFAVDNWVPVGFTPWPGLEVETRLPVLLLSSFLLGFVPTLILHRTSQWWLKRKLASAEKALCDLYAREERSELPQSRDQV